MHQSKQHQPTEPRHYCRIYRSRHPHTQIKFETTPERVLKLAVIEGKIREITGSSRTVNVDTLFPNHQGKPLNIQYLDQGIEQANHVVGTPTVSDGMLKSFNISDNGKQLQVNGNLSGNRVVDLLAPQVVVGKSANVNATDAINVSSGKSNFDYKTAQIEALDAASNAPVLDGHIFGSMRAGTIRIHATDKRAKQNIQNAAITGTRYLNIDSKGNLSIQSANLTGAQMELFARDTDIKGTVTSHSANKSSSGKEAKNVQHFRSGRNKTETFYRQQYQCIRVIDFEQ